jgi:hypothetical protein
MTLHIQLRINHGPTDLPKALDLIDGVQRLDVGRRDATELLGNCCAAASSGYLGRQRQSSS